MRLVHNLEGRWVGLSPFAGKASGPRPPLAFGETLSVEEDGLPVAIAVLDNDIDPNGGTLTLTSAFAALGSATAEQDGTITYTPPPGFAGADTVVYEIQNEAGLTDTAQIDISTFVQGLSIQTTLDNRLEVIAAMAPVNIDVTDPAGLVGSYTAALADLAGGPVPLLPPSIAGIIGDGAVLTASPGLWVFEAADDPTTSLQWQKNGANIAGATDTTLVLGPDDLNAVLTVLETYTGTRGSRTAVSNGLGVLSFEPSQDAELFAWFDASDATTITDSAGEVISWASKIGGVSADQPSAPQRPTTGTRTLGGLNALSFGGTAHLYGPVTLPNTGQFALHMAVDLDGANNAFAALVSMDGASSDFQLDANSTTGFEGRLNITGAGSTVNLSGGPFSGPMIVQILFNLPANQAEVFVNGVQRATTTMSAALDASQTIGILTNRSRNASVPGAVGEIVLSSSLTNRTDVAAYLGAKWGIA